MILGACIIVAVGLILVGAWYQLRWWAMAHERMVEMSMLEDELLDRAIHSTGSLADYLEADGN